MIHAKDYRYCCLICNRKFLRKHDLDNHIKTHSQIRKFKCEYCPQKFLTTRGLKNHIGVHTGELPYKCGLCPMAFKFSSSSSLHRSKVHMVDGHFVCKNCTYKITGFAQFKKHLDLCQPEALKFLL